MRRKKNRSFCNVMLCLMLAVMLIFGISAQSLAAEADRASAQGSITLTLSQTDSDGNKTVYPNVALKLYKVGSLRGDGSMVFVTDSGFASSGINFNSISTANGWSSAASVLAGLADQSGVTPVTGITDASGQAIFSNLDAGVYLVIQGSATSRLEMSPVLLTVPMQSNGSWNYQVTTYPKFTPKNGAETKISVTKRLFSMDDDLNIVPMAADNATYKVGIYLDKEGTIPLRDDYQKDITITGASSGTAAWSDVPDGTYYVFELDSDGNPLTLNEEIKVSDTQNFYYNVKNASGDESNEAVVDQDSNASVVSYVDNYYYDVPDGYYSVSLLNITKKLMVDGEETDTGDTFYAGVFEKDTNGDLTLLQMVELKNNGTVEASLALPTKDVPKEITYTVLETDKEGNPLDKASFEYAVSGEGDVTVSEESGYEGSITITNSKDSVTPTPAPTSTPTPTSEPDITDIPSNQRGTTTAADHSSGTSAAKPTKTGDDTSVVAWLAVVVLAAAVIVTAVVVRKKRK